MKWIYKPTNFQCNSRKEMKEYLGGVSRFNAAFKYGDVYYNDDYIASDESIYTNSEKHSRS